MDAFVTNRLNNPTSTANRLSPIHIIEDDGAVSDSLAFLLIEMGHPVRTYRSAEEFMDQPAPNSDEIVIVDLGLPGKNGTHVIRELNCAKSPPQILVISGQSQSQINHLVAGLDVGEVIRKPLNAESLSAYLE